jgi:HTH-like domain
MLHSAASSSGWRLNDVGLATDGSRCCSGGGLLVNHKKVYRLYREAGLAVRRRKRRKLAAGARIVLAPPTQPNQRWSMDFMGDSLATGRTLPHLEPRRRLQPRSDRVLNAFRHHRGHHGQVLSARGSCAIGGSLAGNSLVGRYTCTSVDGADTGSSALSAF